MTDGDLIDDGRIEADERPCPDCFSLPGVAHDADCLERKAERELVDRAILKRVDAYYCGGLVVSFKSHDVGRPNEPTTYLYRSMLLEIMGVDEDEITP